jgi:aldose 1-epimerase
MKKIMTVCLSAVAIAAGAYAEKAVESAPGAKESKEPVQAPVRENVRRPARRNSGMPQQFRQRAASHKFLGYFGRTADGKVAKIYRIEGRGGLILDVTDYGGRVVRCYAPDKHGNLADVTLGWNTAEEYNKNGFSMGTLIGRFGNRIKDGKFKLDGKEYSVPINENKPPRHNALHGGTAGWDTAIWAVKPLREGPAVRGLELMHVSKDGDMGFPGTVTCKVKYRVMPDNVWSVEYEATTDKPTVINLTHHSYWNLAGEASGNVLKQQLQIFADSYTDVDDGLIPVKDLPVKGTGFDFTALREIGSMADWMAKNDHLKPMDNWYDHNFVLRGKAGEWKQAAIMKDPLSGRKLEIWTTEPCMQVYGAQNMDGTMDAKAAGKKLVQFAGIALETQHYPDSPNRPDFPSTVLRPGETYRSRTEYRFTAE